MPGLSLLRAFHGNALQHRRPWPFIATIPCKASDPHGSRISCLCRLWLQSGNPRAFASNLSGEKGASSERGDACWDHSFQHSLVGGLAKHAVAFPVKGNAVEVLDSPSQFYNTLKSCIRSAKDRVVISALYVGTGPMEQELLDVVAESLGRKPGLQALLLFDALRSTRKVRGKDGPGSADQAPKFRSSTEMLTQMLLADSAKWRLGKKLPHDNRIRVALYRTPDLTKRLERILPSRLNEIVGVCHMKAYIFDNHVLMSGANLSSSYFTNRQDRYILIRDCPDLADYLCELVDTIASFSYILDTEGSLRSNAVGIDPRASPVLFRKELLNALRRLLDSHSKFGAKYARTSDLIDLQGGLWLDGQCANTWVFPTVQIGSLGMYQDELCIMWLLANLPSGSCVHFASAYFNLTKEFQAALIQASMDKRFKVLTAAPQANGFYGSRGISGLIPKAYSLLEKDFYEQTCQQASEDVLEGNGLRTPMNHKLGVQLFEYKRPNWTFHAKGMWCYLPHDGNLPSMTLIGSSNFGFRSRQRDIEAQLFVVTMEPALRKKLQEETDSLFLHGHQVHGTVFLDPDRYGGPVSSFAAQLVRSWL
ncbi:hypothetical protein GOP47_0019937 [Adiantum capillus-veneris]|uniref:CDP-diacylglycerol--glycerol-3-phosphate 3-phosphatidyltransferase n=1 Tax=Adiantum capillus-veneris TaxID=13818 RepID=A0A9D4Z929_ADICA|nr:hypothetical protein GOP47_0019937 [Adiantum capillus-veneris]